MTPHVVRKRRARKRRILESAVSAFRQRGYHGTSVADIARALHLTKGSLYHYFADKQAILFHCHDQALDRVLGEAERVLGHYRSPAERLREMIHAFVRITVSEFHGTALSLEFRALAGPRLRSVLRRRDRFEAMLRGIVQEGVRRGQFRAVDVKLAVFAILGSINWIVQWYRPGGAADAEAIATAFADLFWKGLKKG